MQQQITAYRVSKYGVFYDPYYPVFGMNTGKNMDQKKLRIWIHLVQPIYEQSFADVLQNSRS